MTEPTIFIVMADSGIGQDRFSEPVMAFTSEAAANAFAADKATAVRGVDANEQHSFYVMSTELQFD